MFFNECSFRLGNPNFGGKKKTAKPAFTLVFYRGPGESRKNTNFAKNEENVENVLCFTALDAIP